MQKQIQKLLDLSKTTMRTGHKYVPDADGCFRFSVDGGYLVCSRLVFDRVLSVSGSGCGD
ncbi:hypothetical protein [Chamaesiphon polymorphus]|uniref:Uncharacterized protein n=1 Tax=Chamaesiphon polymorphus CCALA 037 TaxID=2107692 RepID=A0A2T1GE86_9CYAN|nr:hypothetical protein [Chamaesiphon polymorphus]PSB55856.1 hypothetical protein C7B77_13715 [Chamaesiphon polymorphus CCALA 037]